MTVELSRAAASSRSESEKSGEKAARILDTAFGLFARHGYADTRMDAVAREAGIAKGTVYLYFASKEELFRGVVERKLAPAVSAIEQMADASDLAPQERLAALYDRLSVVIVSDAPGEVLRLVIGESARFPELADIYFNAVVGPALARMQALIGGGMNRGELRDSPVRDYPMAFLAPVLTAALWRMLFQGRHPVDVKSFLAAYTDLAMRGIRVREDEA